MTSITHTTVNIKRHVISIIIIILILSLIAWYMLVRITNQLSFQLKKIGYSNDEISLIVETDDKTKNYILNNDYNNSIVQLLDVENYNSEHLEKYLNYQQTNKTNAFDTVILINNNISTYKKGLEKIFQEDYYIPTNLERYVSYYLNDDTTPTDTISIINVNADHNGYEFDHETDMTKGNLILTNKYYKLKQDYVPDDLIKLGAYSTWGSIRKEVYDAFVQLVNDAKKEGYSIISISPFRDYDTQNSIYKNGVKNRGLDYALRSIAKPSYSEHQTGLALDVRSGSSSYVSFGASKEFPWMQTHAHEYGFILRYPDGKQYLTGYKYESWHYRYVGTAVATKIKELGITFDEYYAYFCEYKNEC